MKLKPGITLIGLGGTLFSGLSAYAKSNGKIDNEFKSINMSVALSTWKTDNESKRTNMSKALKWYQFSAEKMLFIVKLSILLSEKLKKC